MATVSSSCEQRLELMREQSQQLLEQTRVQASQSLLELSVERQRCESLCLELEGSQKQVDEGQEELEVARDLLRLRCEEAEMDERCTRGKRWRRDTWKRMGFMTTS